MFFISTLALFLSFLIRFPLFGWPHSNRNGCLEPVRILFDGGQMGCRIPGERTNKVPTSK